MITTFTYEEEKGGLVQLYTETNPEHWRRNYPDHIEILTGDDMPNFTEEQ